MLVRRQIEGLPGSDQAGRCGFGALRQAAWTRKILAQVDMVIGSWMIGPLAKMVAPLLEFDRLQTANE